jgi:hypothetical protein
MATSFDCPSCGGEIRPRRAAPATVRCPRCEDVVEVPDGVTPDPGAAEYDAIPVATPVGDGRPRPGPGPGRVRRRRDDPEPEPAGLGGGAVWAVVGVGLLTAVVVGAVFLSRPAAAWRAHESAAGGYRIDLPADLRADVRERIGMPPVPGMSVEGTVHRRGYYVVAWGEIQGRQWRTDDQILAEGLKGGIATGKPERAVDGKVFKVGGFPARDLEVWFPGGEAAVLRVIVADTRFYLLTVGGRGFDPRGPDAARFLESFQITDPKLAEGVPYAERVAREQKAVRDKAEAEWKAAEEKAAKDRAYTERVTAANKAFVEAPFAGRRPPDPRYAGQKMSEVTPYPFETASPDGRGVSAAVTLRSAVAPAALGPGVRGNAAYLRPGAVPAEDRQARHAVWSADGYTLAGWVRTRYAGVDLFRVAGPGDPLAEVVVGRGAVTARVARDGPPTVLAHNFPADEGWHHVALVVDRRADRPEARLYFDGARVAAGKAAREVAAEGDLFFGGVSKDTAGWPKPPDRDGNPGEPGKADPVAAIDELATVARPLTEAEVGVLSGRTPPLDVADADAPPPPIEVRLTAGPDLGPLAAVAFDPDRKVVWAATGAGPDGAGGPPRLRRLSYPGFEEQAAWDLPGPVTAAALDRPRNRLFLAVGAPGTAAAGPLTAWPQAVGRVQRYDLDTLPKGGGRAVPDAEGREDFAVAALAVAPDGATVYFTAATAKDLATAQQRRELTADHALYRQGDSLAAAAEVATEAERVTTPNRLELSPDGRTLEVLANPRQPVAGRRQGLYEIDTRTWSRRAVHPVGYLFHTDWVSVSPRRFFVAPHPTYRDNTVAPVYRHVPADRPAGAWGVGLPAAGEQFLGRFAGGQLLVASGPRPVGAGGPSVRVYSTYGRDVSRRPSWPVTAELVSPRVGGPFWTSPDGRFLVFRAGQVVTVGSPADLSPGPPPGPADATPRPHPPLAPLPQLAPGFRQVPAATAFPGLRFYLPCDEVADGQVGDAVSGKPAGKLGTAELVRGARGRALRLTATARTGPGLVLTDPSALAVPAGKPFTVALWVRAVDGNRGDWNSRVVEGRTGDTPVGGPYTLRREFQFGGYLRESGWFKVSHRPDLRDNTWWTGGGTVTVADPAAWHHFALTRDGQGAVRLAVDGVGQPGDKFNKFDQYAGPFEYESFRFATPLLDYVFTVEVDEFCVFGRALTDDELAALAGRKALPGK